MSELLSNPIVQAILLAVAAYLGYLIITDKDKDGHPEINLPGGRSIEVDQRIVQDLISRLASNGLSPIADLLSAMLSGSQAESHAQAKVVASQLNSVEGRYALMGKAVRAYLQDMSVSDRDEFRSLMSHMSDLAKNVSDDANRTLADESLKVK